jgi:hypothetical protein
MTTPDQPKTTLNLELNVKDSFAWLCLKAGFLLMAGALTCFGSFLLIARLSTFLLRAASQ